MSFSLVHPDFKSLLAALPALALITSGCAKRSFNAPEDEAFGGDVQYASSIRLIDSNLLIGIIERGKKETPVRIELCWEFRDIAGTPGQAETARAHQILSKVQAGIKTWATAAALTETIDFVWTGGVYESCKTQTLNDARMKIFLFWSSKSMNAFYQKHMGTSSGSTVAFMSARTGLMAIDLERSAALPQGPDFVVLHELGHAFGLADTYYLNWNGSRGGAAQGQPPAVMNGAATTLQPDDINGVKKIASLLRSNKPISDTDLCQEGYVAYTPRTLPFLQKLPNHDTVYCRRR